MHIIEQVNVYSDSTELEEIFMIMGGFSDNNNAPGLIDR